MHVLLALLVLSCVTDDAPATGVIELKITARKAATVRVTLDNGKEPRTVQAASGTTVLNVPRGDYRITLESPHFARSRHEVTVGETRTTIAAELKPLPVLSGTVLIRASGEPLAGATVKGDAGGEPAFTDARGRFALEVDPEQWPERLSVLAFPYSEATIAVPEARANATLDTVRLTMARSIQVTVETPVKQIELRRLNERRHAEPVRTMDYAERLTFDELSPGTYLVVAKGEKPWQQRVEKVDLAEVADAAVTLRVEPFPLRLSTTFDGEPLGKATVRLDNENFWQAEVELNDEGFADLELWQGGRFGAIVLSTATSAPFNVNSEIAEDDREWTIAVPNREITGVVVDAQSGSPVPAVALSLSVRGEEGPIAFHAKGDEHGRFRIVPVHHGKHTLRVATHNRPPVELTYMFNEPEEKRHLTVRMDSSATVRLRVTDPRGLPVGGARAIQFRDGIRMEGRTDNAGIIDVPVPTDGPCDVYLVPRDGSFAVARLGVDVPETSLVIPPGVSRIVLRAESEDERPLANMPLTMRYNGHLLPRDVVSAIAVVQGARIASDATGTIVLDRMPTGVYEFSSAKLVVTPGENVAVMRFAR